MFLTRIERVSDGPEPSGLSIILQEQMGMTGVEPAYHGLKARCIAVLLHTRMSHAGRTTSGVAGRPGDVRSATTVAERRPSALRRPEWNGDFEPTLEDRSPLSFPIRRMRRSGHRT